MFIACSRNFVGARLRATGSKIGGGILTRWIKSDLGETRAENSLYNRVGRGEVVALEGFEQIRMHQHPEPARALRVIGFVQSQPSTRPRQKFDDQFILATEMILQLLADSARQRRTRTTGGDSDLQPATVEHRRRDEGAPLRLIGDVDWNPAFTRLGDDGECRRVIAGGIESEPRVREIARPIPACDMLEVAGIVHRGHSSGDFRTDNYDVRAGLDQRSGLALGDFAAANHDASAIADIDKYGQISHRYASSYYSDFTDTSATDCGAIFIQTLPGAIAG